MDGGEKGNAHNAGSDDEDGGVLGGERVHDSLSGRWVEKRRQEVVINATAETLTDSEVGSRGRIDFPTI